MWFSFAGLAWTLCLPSSHFLHGEWLSPETVQLSPMSGASDESPEPPIFSARVSNLSLEAELLVVPHSPVFLPKIEMNNIRLDPKNVFTMGIFLLWQKIESNNIKSRCSWDWVCHLGLFQLSTACCSSSKRAPFTS